MAGAVVGAVVEAAVVGVVVEAAGEGALVVPAVVGERQDSTPLAQVQTSALSAHCAPSACSPQLPASVVILRRPFAPFLLDTVTVTMLPDGTTTDIDVVWPVTSFKTVPLDNTLASPDSKLTCK